MSDPTRTLTTDEVREAAPEGWRQVLGTIRARYRTGDFATGLALVDRIGAAAEEAGHHPDITLTYPAVAISLSSHDVGGITSRDIELAGTISGLAAEAGAEADPASLAEVELGLDTDDKAPLQPFYAALMGAEAQPGGLSDPTGQLPAIWFQDRDASHVPAEGEPDQRWHLDVWVPVDAAEARLQAVIDAGGRLVSDEAAPRFWVVADAEGNRSCICTVATR